MCELESLPHEHIVRSYGGHYFSPEQALSLQYLRDNLPADGEMGALAALVVAGSRCAASPGHTAQPFQPTPALLPHIALAWKRDVATEVVRALEILGPRHARVMGEAHRADALVLSSKASVGDLVFLEPPYSDVQYSRFYHVLEGIAIGGYASVIGAGRVPSRQSASNPSSA